MLSPGSSSQLLLLLPEPPTPLLCRHPASSGMTSTAPCSLAELTWAWALAKLALASVQYNPLTNIAVQLPIFPCIFPQIKLLSAHPPKLLPQPVEFRFGEDQHFAPTIAYIRFLCNPVSSNSPNFPAASCSLAPKLFYSNQWAWTTYTRKGEVTFLMSSHLTMAEGGWRSWWWIKAAFVSTHILAPVLVDSR